MIHEGVRVSSESRVSKRGIERGGDGGEGGGGGGGRGGRGGREG